MSDLDHRPGVREVNLVVRHLKLEGVEENNKTAILNEIDHKYGIDSVSYDDKSQTLNVAYDASHCQLDGIEDIIRSHGGEVAHDWWTHLKESYYMFIDQNVKDNANHVPLSCHKTPPGARKK